MVCKVLILHNSMLSWLLKIYSLICTPYSNLVEELR